MATTTVPALLATAYPAAQVAAVLRDALITAVRAIARIRGTAVPSRDDDLIVAVIEIDSLSVVEILNTLDELLGFEVGDYAVRPGGYNSISEAIDDVGKRIAKEWRRRHGGAQP